MVYIEYDLFEVHLGPKRTIICKRGKSKVPSDLQGIIYCDLDKKYRAEIKLLEWLRFLNSTNKTHQPV